MSATDLVAWCKLLGFIDEPAPARCEIGRVPLAGSLHVTTRVTRVTRDAR